jgi:hypothetical protein
MKNPTRVILLMALLLPVSLAAQQDPAARVRAAIGRAEAAGIPVSLLEARVAEGRAKGVPMDRIAVAVERRAAALTSARDAMSGPRALSEGELAAGADAVESGIGGEVLRALIEGARAEDGAVAIAVLTFLHREQGLPVDQALARVKEALSRGPDALRSLPAQAAAARGRRGPPGTGGAAGPPAGVPGPGGQQPRGRGGPPGGIDW